MTAVVLFLGVAIVVLSVGVACLGVVQVRLVREVSALRRARTTSTLGGRDGRAIEEALRRYRRQQGGAS